MKKIAVIVFALGLLTVSCKKEEKQEIPAEEVKTEATGLQIVADSTQVSWTAYKTTEKVPVGGSFTQIELQRTQEGNTYQEVLEGSIFSIPVTSVFTNNPERDGKLINFFFNALKNTELIKGEIHFKGDNTVLALTINGVTKDVPVETTFENNKFAVNGVINLEDFDALGAVESINKACFDLHKGADGVSKTWSDVAISGSIQFE
jgi:polyisoprenoid-binding protein YceI